MNMISDSLTSCTDSNFVSCLLFLAFNVLVLMYLIEQVERGAGTSGKTEKIQVIKHRRLKEDTDSDDSEFWMLKSSSGSESELESDEENCKGASFCFFLLVLLSSLYRNLN